jgi:Polysaccharide deacetylase
MPKKPRRIRRAEILMLHDWTRAFALSVLSVLFATVMLAHAQEPKEMAITFDDLPFGYPRNLTIEEQREAVTRVLAVLDKHRVTATVFVIGRSVTDENRGLVDAVVRAGHFVGSHSFSHQDLGVVCLSFGPTCLLDPADPAEPVGNMVPTHACSKRSVVPLPILRLRQVVIDDDRERAVAQSLRVRDVRLEHELIGQKVERRPQVVRDLPRDDARPDGHIVQRSDDERMHGGVVIEPLFDGVRPRRKERIAFR